MTSPRASAAAALSAVVAMTLVLTGCGEDQPAPTASTTPSGIRLDGDFSGDGPGTLKTADTLPTVDRRIIKVSSIAARISYVSQSGIDRTQQLVSGSVFAPAGPPPPGGWPIIAFGHGTDGVQHECAPSLSPSLLGASGAVATLVKEGYVVALPDYQGLGLNQTYHPYLDDTTEGHNMIDAVRAARKLIPHTSVRWLAYGASQGGQAAWAANEQASSYGAGLRLVGSVSVSPAADISGMADLAAGGNLTLEQGVLLQWILVALKNSHPELNLDDYRHGIVREKWDVFSACEGEPGQQRAELAKQITPDDLRPATPAAVDKLRGYLQQMSLPKFPAQAPMLVLFGANDRVVFSPWTIGAVGRACSMGDVVESYLVPDRGHDDIDGTAALDWIKRRFDGGDPLNTCLLPDGPVSVLSAKPWYVGG